MCEGHVRRKTSFFRGMWKLAIFSWMHGRTLTIEPLGRKPVEESNMFSPQKNGVDPPLKKVDLLNLFGSWILFLQIYPCTIKILTCDWLVTKCAKHVMKFTRNNNFGKAVSWNIQVRCTTCSIFFWYKRNAYMWWTRNHTTGTQSIWSMVGFFFGEVIPLNWPCANLVLNFKKGNRKWQIYANMPYIHVRIHGTGTFASILLHEFKPDVTKCR